MSVIHALRLSRAPAAALSSVGILWGAIAASMPDIKAAVGASDAQLGAALLMSAVGAMCSMAVAPKLAERLGAYALPLLGLLICIGALLPMGAGSVTGLGLAMFGVGATVSLLDITANVRISSLEARHGLHLMNVNHAMFSFAFAASAYATGLARQAGAGPQAILPVVALCLLVFAAAMLERRPVVIADDADAAQPRRIPWAAILLTGAVLFCAFIGENAIEAWSALHIERTLEAPAGFGSFGPAMLGLVMGLGRMSGQLAAARVGETALIAVSALLGVAGALILAAAPTPGVALLGVGVAGAGLAAVVPTANSILGRHVSERARSVALSRAWIFGFLGFFIGPSMMGGVAELFGLRVSFVVVAVLIALILPAVAALSRRPVAQAHRP